MKYAFQGGRGRIVLGFACSDGAVAWTVADDGMGLAGNGPSLGQVSCFVEAFVRQLGGSLANAFGACGTTFTVRLPRTVLAAD